jgi:RimJ/RimL family protein N-acetyltransferase
MLAIENGWAQAEVADQAQGVLADLVPALHPDHPGNGYATEAMSALIRLCFGKLGLRRVVNRCFAENESSWRLMERVGMRREAHHVSKSLHRSAVARHVRLRASRE